MTKLPTDPFDRDIDIAAAVNEEKTLANCLLRSPDIVSGRARLRSYVGYATAGSAYNRAIDESNAEYIVLVHQDVYLPRNFLAQLRREIDALNIADPEWAVAGSVGLDMNENICGQVWCSGVGRLIGDQPATPVPVISIDELLLVVRRSSGIRFDESLPSFHMYGTDVILEARTRGQSSYVINAPVVHHSKPVVSLDGGYREAYKYMQRKWRDSLPIPNLIATVYPTTLWLFWRNVQLRRRHRGRTDRPDPIGDPVMIARELGFEQST